MKFSMPNYDNWKLTTPESNEKIAHFCEYCGTPIYVGEEFLGTDEGRVHEDCFDEFAWQVMGVHRETAEEDIDYGED